ncbi:MAG TPA: hypothetical protein DE313_08315 [Ruminococcus sp.]|nr:hypothetical protein [Ruminococcus sp.]
MSLDENNGLLYFNSADCIYSYDVATNTMNEFASVDTSSGYCYGLRIADGTLYSAVSTSPNVELVMKFSGECIKDTLITIPNIRQGDVNGDGVISIIDVTDIQKYSAGGVILTGEQLAVADYNNDGIVNIVDATEIQKFMVSS